MQEMNVDENPGENAILQIFNKTKCANLVSNAADATDQGSGELENPFF
jgi:hypothetical protein